MAENRVIGRGNTLPWRIPTDMRHFMRTTMGKPVLMGRKTFESMKAPLPGRTNLVLTQDPGWQRDGVIVVHSFDEGIERAEQQCLIDGQDEMMVAGGAGVYELALPRADRLHVTFVHGAPDGDTFFPEVDFAAWHEVSRQDFPASDQDSLGGSICLYERHPASIAG